MTPGFFRSFSDGPIFIGHRFRFRYKWRSQTMSCLVHEPNWVVDRRRSSRSRTVVDGGGWSCSTLDLHPGSLKEGDLLDLLRSLERKPLERGGKFSRIVLVCVKVRIGLDTDEPIIGVRVGIRSTGVSLGERFGT